MVISNKKRKETGGLQNAACKQTLASWMEGKGVGENCALVKPTPVINIESDLFCEILNPKLAKHDAGVCTFIFVQIYSNR